MAGTLLPCGMANAANVTFDTIVDNSTDPPAAGAKWVYAKNGIALVNSGDTLVLDFGNPNKWHKGFYGGYSDASDTISNYHLLLKSGQVDYVYGGFSEEGSITG